jgi:penicillin-binding protein 2
MIAYNRYSQAKIYSIIILFLIALCCVAARLVYLQLYLGKALESLSIRNFTRYNMILVPRGDITDTNGQLLATNRPVTNIFWSGTGQNNLSEEQSHALEQISKIIPLGHIEIKNIAYAERYKRQLKLATDVPFNQLSKIAELFQGNKNIKIQTHFERYYPCQMLASHVIGYLGTETYGIYSGKMGLERYLQNDLIGKTGVIQVIVNSFGKPIAEQQLNQIVPGKNIRTTIDLGLQKIAEHAFPSQFSGACIVMESSTGAIRSLLSRPSFDPTYFLRPIDRAWWQGFSEQHPFLNRAYNACYPPASLFKIVSMAAFLEEGIITPTSFCYCNGEFHFGDRILHCHKEQGHGRVSAMDALAVSCNILFWEAGRHIHIDTLAQYAAKFGLGEKTGFSFPEKNGFIPTSEWKRKSRGERWWPGETLSACIGQTFMLATPLQIARMVASTATGHLVKPRLLEDEEIDRKPLSIQPSTLAFLQQAMRQVVKCGSARRLSGIKHLNIFGKTGTAQTGSRDKKLLGKEFISHGWFVVNFKYKHHPFLTMVIIVEHAGASSVAVQVAKEFIIQYKKYMDKIDAESSEPIKEEDSIENVEAFLAEELPTNESIQSTTAPDA